VTTEARGNVFVTGSRGFTGSYVCAALREVGYRAIGLKVSEEFGVGEHEVLGDLSDTDSLVVAMDRVHPAFIIHLAGIAFTAHTDPLELYRVNLLGTLNLLEAVVRANVMPEKIILASSANVYGANPVCPVSENFAPMPVNHYAMSKLSMELLTRSWTERLPIVVTRPFNYTGVGQSEQFVVPKIVKHYSNRSSSISLGNLNVEREFNDVRMVARAYVRLMEAAPAGTTVNICTGIGHKLLDILGLIEKITDHTLKVEVDSKLARPNELRTLVGDPARLVKLVADLPRYSIEETLEWMVASARSPSRS
jgi:nucleoside-diphosphate-sugar epimerase